MSNPIQPLTTTTHQPSIFKFPSSLPKPFPTFPTASSITAHLSALSNRQRNMPLSNWYFSSSHPLQRKYFRIKCKFCHCYLLFKSQSQVYRLIQSQTTHLHTPTDQSELMVLQWLQQSYQPGWSLERAVREVTNRMPVDVEVVRQVVREFMGEEAQSFGFLEKYLINKGVELKYEDMRWGFPEMIVVVSEGMKQMYGRFGDAVGFSIFRRQHKTHPETFYNIGIFSAFDTNMRSLIVGIAYYQSPTTQTFTKIFDNFIHLHKKSPQSISTQPHTQIQQSLRFSNLFTGIHIFDPSKLVNSVLKNQPSIKQRLRELILCRDIDRHRELWKGLGKIKEVEVVVEVEGLKSLKEVYKQLEPKAEKIYEVSIPPKFVGLREFGARRLGRMVAVALGRRRGTELGDIGRVLRLEQKLRVKSQKRFIICKQPSEVILNDPHISQLRQTLQCRVFRHFLSNYLAALNTFQLHFHNPISNSFIIQPKTKNQPQQSQTTERSPQPSPQTQVYYINDWICSCDELEHTGIPCPHLITAARSVKEMGFMAMVRRRWVKGIEGREEGQEEEQGHEVIQIEHEESQELEMRFESVDFGGES